jgi:hypothetical protein
MWILVLLRMIMWCKYMTCLRIFSVQSYCLNSLFYVNKCQCCNKCSLMMICDKFQINRTQYAGVITENDKLSSLWKINVAMLDDVTKLHPRIHGKIASKRSRIWDSQYVQKSAEHTQEKHPHNIYAPGPDVWPRDKVKQGRKSFWEAGYDIVYQDETWKTKITLQIICGFRMMGLIITVDNSLWWLFLGKHMIVTAYVTIIVAESARTSLTHSDFMLTL